MITEDYVSFETAKFLKEKGFDGECRAFWKDWNGEIRLCSCNRAHMFDYCHNSMLERYNGSDELNISAPTLQMAMKWLREKHAIIIELHHQHRKEWYAIVSSENPLGIGVYTTSTFNTYEQACESAIKYCLENLI